jgi:hypothetical protein
VDSYLVNVLLHDKSSSSRRYQLFKHFFEVFGYLFESAFNSLVLSLIKGSHESVNRFRRRLQVLASFAELFALFRKVAVLLERLLIHMTELLQVLVDRREFLDELCHSK